MANDNDWDKHELNQSGKLIYAKWIFTGVVIQIIAYAMAVFHWVLVTAQIPWQGCFSLCHRF